MAGGREIVASLGVARESALLRYDDDSMKSYSSFRFTGYPWNHHAGKISLQYALDRDVDFEELIFLPEPVTDERLKAREWEIERLLFMLHLIGGISYYKTCLPKTIEVQSGQLTLPETKFWNTVYEKGLGEFFFRNDIDYRGLLKFPALKQKEGPRTVMRKKDEENPLKRILVPIGGGKDSVVTAEILKKSGANVTLLRMEGHPLVDDLSHALGLPMITVRRQLSPILFDLNEDGALNGHVPITAYLSILAVLLAELYDFDAVVMSNERSANEGNVEYRGMTVNHQWSKSAEFERMLRNYLKNTVQTRVEYFSLLRPLSELSITQIFAQYPQYFEKATSCNRNWKILEEERSDVRWCGTCPKCAFVFLCMAAFVSKTELLRTFGKNLFDDESLLALYRELLGIERFKPFECVGTIDEVRAAFLLAKAKGSLKGTPVMTMFELEAFPRINDPEALIGSVLTPSKEHFVPPSLLPLLN